MKHKKLITALTAVFTVIVAIAVFLLVWFWGDTYDDFDEFDPVVSIPGLNEGAVPQGLASYSASYEITQDGETKSGTQDYYFISAYMKSGPSRIYVTGEKTGYVGYVTMTSQSGEDFYGHSGGIATNGENLWVASDGYVYVAKTSDSSTYTNIAKEIIAKAQHNTAYINGELSDGDGEEALQSVKFTASFNANCGADFLFFYDATGTDKLYVGEFYRAGNYETDKRHRVTTPAGDYNTAFVYEYNVYTGSTYTYGLGVLSSSDGNAEASEKVPKIQYVYSITGQIQGLARTRDGALVLSQSYGLDPSHILYYDWSKVYVSSNRKLYNKVVGNNLNYEGVKTVNGAQFTTNPYVYFVDSSCLVRDYTLPSMSEGLCVTSDSKVNVLFESGCYKYKAFVRQITDSIYSFTPRKES